MYQGEDIKENIAARKLNIIKGFVETDDILEKAAQSKQVGQTKVGSDGVTRVWTQLPNGKYDWRRKKASSDDKKDVKKDESKKSQKDDSDSPKNSKQIGVTKSGKKIYEDGSEHEQDEDWTSKDHEEAAEAHQVWSLNRTQTVGQKVSNADLSKTYSKHVEKQKTKSTSKKDDVKSDNDFKPHKSFEGAMKTKSSAKFVSADGEHCQISRGYIGNKISIMVTFMQPNKDVASKHAIRSSSANKILKFLNDNKFKNEDDVKEKIQKSSDSQIQKAKSILNLE